MIRPKTTQPRTHTHTYKQFCNTLVVQLNDVSVVLFVLTVVVFHCLAYLKKQFPFERTEWCQQWMFGFTVSYGGHWRLYIYRPHCVDPAASCPAAFSAQESQFPVFLPHQFGEQKYNTGLTQEHDQQPAQVRPAHHPVIYCHIYTVMKIRMLHVSTSY